MNTDQAMEALTEIVADLHDRRETLTALEWRTYAWARASLAVLTAIRVEEALARLDTSDYPVTS